MTGCCEQGKETSGSIKCGEFLDKPDGLLAFQERLLFTELRNYWFCRVRPRKLQYWHLLSDTRWRWRVQLTIFSSNLCYFQFLPVTARVVTERSHSIRRCRLVRLSFTWINKYLCCFGRCSNVKFWEIVGFRKLDFWPRHPAVDAGIAQSV